VKSPSSTISGESRKVAGGDENRQLHKITFNKKSFISLKHVMLEGKLELKRDSGTEFVIKFAIPEKE
jgi:hypothetical protein